MLTAFLLIFSELSEMKMTPNFWANAFALAGALTCIDVAACSPIKTIGVYFEKNSSAVSADQVKKIAQWMIELRETYPRHESIDVSGAVAYGETSPKLLGSARA